MGIKSKLLCSSCLSRQDSLMNFFSRNNCSPVCTFLPAVASLLFSFFLPFFSCIYFPVPSLLLWPSISLHKRRVQVLRCISLSLFLPKSMNNPSSFFLSVAHHDDPPRRLFHWHFAKGEIDNNKDCMPGKLQVSVSVA